MQFHNQLRTEGHLATPESVAAEFNAYARHDIEAAVFPALEQAYRRAVSTNLYLTKAAIVIQWLRLHGRASQGTTLRPAAILDEFETLTFDPIPEGGQQLLVEHVRKLIALTVRLQKCVDEKGLSKDEAARQMLQISKDWFGLMFADEDLLCRLSLMYGAPLLSVIHSEMANIGKMIEVALYGKVAH
jgi:hypothetical protein